MNRLREGFDTSVITDNIKEKIIIIYSRGKVIHWEMFKKFKIDYTNKWYMHNPASVLENDTHKLLWDFGKQTDQGLEDLKVGESIYIYSRYSCFLLWILGDFFSSHIDSTLLKREAVSQSAIFIFRRG